MKEFHKMLPPSMQNPSIVLLRNFSNTPSTTPTISKQQSTIHLPNMMAEGSFSSNDDSGLLGNSLLEISLSDFFAKERTQEAV
jgi:hypothetical protein